MRLVLVLFVILCLGCSSCHDEKTAYQQQDPEDLREQLIAYNRQKMENEDSLIVSYVEQHQLNFDRSPTGMRFTIFSGGGTVKPQTFDEVAVRYRIHLLDSTPVYSSDESGLYRFELGRSDAASGFHELVAQMNYGDSARSIWPARLGYGLSGDNDRIPLDAILLVDVWLEER